MTTPSLTPNVSGGLYILVIYIIIYIHNESVENWARTRQTNGKPAQTCSNTRPITVWVWCSWVEQTINRQGTREQGEQERRIRTRKKQGTMLSLTTQGLPL
jgi:hypothetical protein